MCSEGVPPLERTVNASFLTWRPVCAARLRSTTPPPPPLCLVSRERPHRALARSAGSTARCSSVRAARSPVASPRLTDHPGQKFLRSDARFFTPSSCGRLRAGVGRPTGAAGANKVQACPTPLRAKAKQAWPASPATQSQISACTTSRDTTGVLLYTGGHRFESGLRLWARDGSTPPSGFKPCALSVGSPEITGDLNLALKMRDGRRHLHRQVGSRCSRRVNP